MRNAELVVDAMILLVWNVVKKNAKIARSVIDALNVMIFVWSLIVSNAKKISVPIARSVRNVKIAKKFAKPHSQIQMMNVTNVKPS